MKILTSKGLLKEFDLVFLINVLNKIKSCNYLNLVLMRMEAYNFGADDAVALTVDGYVAETAGTNIFIVKNNIISTPSENILLGVKRETVIEIANNMGFMVKQNPGYMTIQV